MHQTISATRRVALTTVLAAVALGAGGCGTDTTDTSASGGSGTPSSTALVIDDGWVKSVDAPRMGAPSPAGGMSMPMSAMSGTLRNPTRSDITVTGGSSPVAGTVQLHETVKTASGAMQMQEKKGGFVVPAGGTFVLQPGGNHVMLMELTAALTNGSTVPVTLTTSAGPVTFTVPVRAFSGGNETYNPSPSSS
ncbi:copper chaperone PCu(A)C [Phycicoccus sp.]|mgnify:CR=1 FL=1|uniref:copper chaperone PCu(A)C n=1 Tax=Phycicoccus sp. TaxID=1902410 RepID=UPI002C5887B1|nr:copper chaperone PCu(A)C [Phycicoccus sp.]HMM95663.1 copper chaperone PCu(A)C [Phycicoccus sp.]